PTPTGHPVPFTLSLHDALPISILDRTTYLISNSLGAMPRGVADAMRAFAETWGTRGVRAWEERWWMLAAEVGDRIGTLMHAPPRSEEHTSELQSLTNIVCRLLL